VIGEDVGHVKAALRHVMGPAAEFELIEFIDARQPPIITVENGIVQLGRAIIGAEIEAEALFCKIRESAAKLFDSAVLMKTGLPTSVGAQPALKAAARRTVVCEIVIGPE